MEENWDMLVVLFTLACSTLYRLKFDGPWKHPAPSNSKLSWKINSKTPNCVNQHSIAEWFPPTPLHLLKLIFSVCLSPPVHFLLAKKWANVFWCCKAGKVSQLSMSKLSHDHISFFAALIYIASLHEGDRITKMLFMSSKGYWIKALTILNCTD